MSIKAAPDSAFDSSIDSKASILLVDDNPANLLALRAMLEQVDVRFIEARTGDEALQQVAARGFAVVLLDVLMPGMNGFETARRIRGSSRSRTTPIIFITGLDLESQWLEEAYALGAVDYLVKPILPLVLEAKVRGFVDLFVEQQRSQREADMLRLLIESTQEYAIFMLDPDGRVTSWNRGAERLSGYRPDEIIGRHFSLFYPDEALARGWPEHELQVTRAEGRFEDVGWRIRKDGSRFWANVVITAVRDSAGQLLGFSKITRDLTQQRLAEENARRLLKAEAAREAAEVNARLLRQQSAMLEAALDCIITIDQSGSIVEFNPAAEMTFGHRREDVVGHELAGLLIPPALRDQHRRGLAHVVATGEASILGRRLEMTALRADGSEFPIEIAVTRLPGDGPPLFTAYLRDISDRRRIEQQRNARLAVSQVLAQSASAEEAVLRVLQAVCESLGWDVGLLWSLDPGTQVLSCAECWRPAGSQFDEFEKASRSRTFERGVGLPGRVWAAGQPAWILDVINDANFPRAPIAAQAGLHAAFGCPITVAGQTVGTVEFFSKELREPDADLLEMMNTICSQMGQFAERKRAERALQESEQRFVRFMQQFPGLAWIKDLDGRYLFVNDAAEQAFRTPRAELYGKTDPEIFSPETAKSFQENDQSAVTHDSGVQVIETLESHGGDLRYSLVSKFPIVGANGRPQWVGGMAIDITDRLRAEEALRDADRRKDEFLAMLAHELRNPLAPIRNALQILRLPQVDSDSMARVTDVMDRQVQHLVRLVDDLLDVSRVMRGRIELRKEHVEFAGIVARAIEIVQPLFEARRHTFSVELPAHSMLVDADSVRMVQVVANLLTNAARYTEDGGTIALTVTRHEDMASLTVRDNGIGIAPDMLPHIFDLFVQADSTSTRAQGGLGVGLTLARTLIELHGGRIEARSPGLGEGSEFTLRFPLMDGPANSPRGEDEGRRPQTGAVRELLIVDDNRDAAKMLAMLLRLKGHSVRVVHDGASALEAVGAHSPELVFLDIGMPGMDGYEVARRIRGRAEWANIKLVALTGWGQEEDRRRTAEAGFDHHLVKPPDPAEIDTVLTELQRE